MTSADGTEIYADATGNPSNPCIVFIHGLALSGAVWNDIFASPKYSKDFYLVSLSHSVLLVANLQ